jgi:dipeptidyl aminopeptidase/acylaminoacyl peptidase
MNRTVHLVDAASLEAIGRVEHAAKLGPLAFSPDGSQLALIAGADIHDPIDGRLFVVSADGGDLTALVPDFPGKFDQVYWTDNATIGFLASEGVTSTLGTIGADGANLTRTRSGEGPVVHHVAHADNGLRALVADAPQHPAELFVMEDGADDPRRATDHNPWLADVPLAEQEVVTYTARDGLELQGLLIRPMGVADGTRVPLITVVHGGPEAHYDHGWLTDYNDPGQVAAARGYAVFYPNYRGSTGRGEDFATSSQGDLAGAEFDDIVDGVDALIERGLVDQDRVGVTGGSYGGYATGWMATRYTDRFAAGVMFVGISDNISKWGTSDIPEELYLVHARQRIWEDYQGFLERSPIFHAGDAQTPLLILHGQEDTRVHPSQSMELYRHIKTRTDTPVRLVHYPGEGHGNRRATAQLDYSLRLLRWFDRYLKSDMAIGAR